MSLADSEKYDELLMTVAGQCGGIQPLLDVFFSFLYRRTDFFHVMQEGDKMGFPEGVAEKIVLRAFKAYEQQAGLAAKKAPVPTTLFRRHHGSRGDRRPNGEAPKISAAPSPAQSATRARTPLSSRQHSIVAATKTAP